MRARTHDRRSTQTASALGKAAIAVLLTVAVLADPVPTSDAPVQAPVASVVAAR